MQDSQPGTSRAVPAGLHPAAKGCLALGLATGALVLLFVTCVPDPDPDDQAGAFIQCTQNQEETSKALRLYATRHQGQYPAQLRELGPPPLCRFGQLEYQSSGREFTLRCSHHGEAQSSR